MANYIVSDTSLTTVANAIRAKSGASSTLSFPDEFVSAISSISSGSGSESVPRKAVNFLDYDGTVVASYTASEFAELAAMPGNPDRSGDDIPLTAQGWNWTLSDAKAYVSAYGALDIGQMYITSDGKTHIKIHIEPTTMVASKNFYLRWTQSVSKGVSVNWGDGSANQTFTGTTAANRSHTYTQPGDYDITLNVTSGTLTFDGTASFSIFGSAGISNTYNFSRIREVRLGGGVQLGGYVFYHCYNLKSVTMPTGITNMGNCTFSECYSLKSVVIPAGVTDIGLDVFRYCVGLRAVSIPNSVTTIGQLMFSECDSLESITIPGSVTTIGNSAFRKSRGLRTITIPNSVTTLNSNVFQDCAGITDVVISTGVESLPTYLFSGCLNLKSVTIPANVTEINAYAFTNCYGVYEYHLQSPTPPTLSNTSAFSGFQAGGAFYVPYSEDHSVLEAYKSATNWSSYASNMLEEPQ